MQRDMLLEHFFSACVRGDRPEARRIVDDVLDTHDAEEILCRLIWPTIEQVQTLFRSDALSFVAHHYATRLLRSLAEQLQTQLIQRPRNGKTVLVCCGNEESEELGALVASDLFEAAGFETLFTGGGIANDELTEQIRARSVSVLVIFGAVAATVPQTRVLIDTLHEMDLGKGVQVAVGGGIFSRAEGLAEEIGADLWANTPNDLVLEVVSKPDHRMSEDQRSVGKKRPTATAA